MTFVKTMPPLLLYLEDASLRIDARGRWYHGEERLHPKVERLFQKNLRVEQQGDAFAYRVQLDFRRAEVLVEDTGYFVVSLMDASSERGFLFKFSDQCEQWCAVDRVSLCGPTLEQSVFCVRIERDGCRVLSKCLPAVHAAIGEYLVEISGQPALSLHRALHGGSQPILRLCTDSTGW